MTVLSRSAPSGMGCDLGSFCLCLRYCLVSVVDIRQDDRSCSLFKLEALKSLVDAPTHTT